VGINSEIYSMYVIIIQHFNSTGILFDKADIKTISCFKIYLKLGSEYY
jgi:hypothetical protein